MQQITLIGKDANGMEVVIHVLETQEHTEEERQEFFKKLNAKPICQ